MGHLVSRNHSNDNEEEVRSYNAYRYPNKTGRSFFASYFLMGGERFEIAQPEAYLFGENSDLNFLGAKPVQFPTFQSSSSSSSNAEAIRPLHCLIALRKDSLKFVRHFAGVDKVENANDTSYTASPHYSIEFAFDCDLPCVITVYYFAVERFDDAGDVIFASKMPNLTSRAYHYDTGCHLFRQTDSVFDPSLYSETELLYNTSVNVIPIVIHCAVQNQDPSSNFPTNQSCSVYANVERSSDGLGYLIKMLKQKLFVDGISFLIQEVYGVENKRNFEYSTKDCCNNSHGLSMIGAHSKHVDETAEPTGECVVCMSDLRDTLILPCRHLCICSSCAETLRYKANNCPICRSPFRALLQIKTMRKFVCSSPYPCKKSAEWQAYYSNYGSTSFVNNRYEFVPLYEALNGAQECTASSNSNNNFVRLHKSTGGSHRSQHSRSSQPTSAASSHSHHNNRPPRAAPRRNHRRKRLPKPVIPIQEVLTPQALNPKNAEKNDMNDIATRTTETSVQNSLPGAVRIVIVGPQPCVSEINLNNFAASLSNRSSLDTLKNAIPMVDFTPNTPPNVKSVSPSASASPKQRPNDAYFDEEEDLKSISSQEDNGSGGDEDDDDDDDEGGREEDDYASFSDDEKKTLADRRAAPATPSSSAASAVLKLDDESGLENDENCIVVDITRRSKEKRAHCPKMDETALSSVSSASGSSNKALLSVSKSAKIEL